MEILLACRGSGYATMRVGEEDGNATGKRGNAERECETGDGAKSPSNPEIGRAHV